MVREYSIEEITELLEKAKEKGFDLGAGCDLEKLTIAELTALVGFVN